MEETKTFLNTRQCDCKTTSWQGGLSADAAAHVTLNCFFFNCLCNPHGIYHFADHPCQFFKAKRVHLDAVPPGHTLTTVPADWTSSFGSSYHSNMSPSVQEVVKKGSKHPQNPIKLPLFFLSWPTCPEL